MARQAPVANELRMLVAALRMVADLERMGDLAAHVSKIARLRYPAAGDPDRAAQRDRGDGDGRWPDGRRQPAT